MTRALNRLHPELEKRGRGRPRIDKREGEDNACGGFELIVALAYHLGWPQMTAVAVKEEVRRLKRRKAFRLSERYVDKRGRNEKGRFTREYSRRADVRESRFESISKKRLTNEQAVAKLIPRMRRLKAQSEIEDGERKMAPDLMKKLETYRKRLLTHEQEMKRIEKERPREFRLLRKHQREWLRLQGKETVYKVDVELDQMLTFHRVSLAHLYAYFVKYFLGSVSTSMLTLLHKIIHLHAKVAQTKEIRKVVIDYNKKDRDTMDVLAAAIDKMNELEVIGSHGKRMVFALGES